MKRTIEVDDTLAECVESAKDSIREEFERYMEANPDTTEAPDYANDLDYSGACSEIVDGAVPIYTYEIDTAHFLHGNELEEAYDNAGLGCVKEDNWKAVAIYCYIDQEVREWYESEKDDLYDAWREKHPLPVEDDAEPVTTEDPDAG